MVDKYDAGLPTTMNRENDYKRVRMRSMMMKMHGDDVEECADRENEEGMTEWTRNRKLDHEGSVNATKKKPEKPPMVRANEAALSR